MLKYFACAAMIIVCGACSAQTQTYQITTTSWHGLSGLYVVPTARTLGQGKLAMGYSESRHVEFVGDGRFLDRQVRATLTYGLTNRIEVSGSYIRDLFTTGDHFRPVLPNQNFDTWALKWRIFDETRRRPDVAIAVRDIFDNMQDVGSLSNVNNGRKWFLLASKRLVERKDTGRFVDGHIGITRDDQATSGMFGTEIALAPMVSFIAEGMWDSPYVNFRGVYLQPNNIGTSDHAGRFIFDTGFRIYPDVLPGFVIDLGFMADSQPEYSWGLSYVAGL